MSGLKIIPNSARQWISKPSTAEFVENTIFAVSVETAMKMCGRPAFIMMDKEADSPAKKKYAAVKEMLYQGICLSLYLGTMKPIKNFFYKGISKFLSKNNPQNAANLKEFDAKDKFIHDKEATLKQELKKISDKVEKKAFKAKVLDEIILLKEEMRNEKNSHLRLGKGAKEMSAIIGSIIMLTVVAPQISHFIIHPIMKVLGMEEKKVDGAKH